MNVCSFCRKVVSTISVRAIVRVSFSLGNSSRLSLPLAVVAMAVASISAAVDGLGLGLRGGGSSGCQSKNEQHLHPCLM